MRDDLWRLLMLNTRLPEALDGDLRAMIGSTRIGAERLAAAGRGAGRRARAGDFFEGVLAHADRRFRACVARLAKGVWRAEEPVDNDCFEPIDGRIAVDADGRRTTRLMVDFAGTSPQMQGLQEQLDRQLDLGGLHGAVVVLRARPARATKAPSAASRSACPRARW